MAHLKRAHDELFRQTPDQRYPSLNALWRHCQGKKERSAETWFADQNP
jgi:hypothetical protein